MWEWDGTFGNWQLWQNSCITRQFQSQYKDCWCTVDCRVSYALAITSFCANLWLHVYQFTTSTISIRPMVFNDRVIIYFYAMWHQFVHHIGLELSFKLRVMRCGNFHRRDTGIQSKKSTGMGTNMSSNWNVNGNWYTKIGGNKTHSCTSLVEIDLDLLKW